jgi:hypothetical protein
MIFSVVDQAGPGGGTAGIDDETRDGPCATQTRLWFTEAEPDREEQEHGRGDGRL